MNIHIRNTRFQIDIDNSITSNNLFIPTASYGFKSMKVYGPNSWNELPPLLIILLNVL